MLSNQLKVLLQRVVNGGRKPVKILLSRGLFDALKMEQRHLVICGNPPNRKVSFGGVEVVVVSGITQPLIEMEPEN